MTNSHPFSGGGESCPRCECPRFLVSSCKAFQVMAAIKAIFSFNHLMSGEPKIHDLSLPQTPCFPTNFIDSGYRTLSTSPIDEKAYKHTSQQQIDVYSVDFPATAPGLLQLGYLRLIPALPDGGWATCTLCRGWFGGVCALKTFLFGPKRIRWKLFPNDVCSDQVRLDLTNWT